MMQGIDPQLLQQILALTQGGGATNNGATQWSGSGPLDGWTVDRRRDVLSTSPNESDTYSDPITRLYRQTGHKTWGQDTADVFDAQGNYIGPSSGDSEALSMAKFIASAVGGYYGTEALNGAMGGAAAGGAGGGLDAASLATSDIGIGGAMAGGGGAAGATGAGGAGLTGAQIASGLKTGVDALGGGGGVAALLGGLAGAADGGDKTQSKTQDPWAPAQDFLKQQIGQGQQLSQQYQAQPFSQSQKAGYNNMASLLDLVNNNAGGLLSGFQANASGANQFQRSNPRGLLQGSSFDPNPAEWKPQTYGRFGG